MSQKKREKRRKSAAQQEATSTDSGAAGSRWTSWLPIFAILATLVAYLPAFSAGFVNWDDGDYVYNNKLVSDPGRLVELIKTPVQGNYHPLTMLSLALNHAISGLEPWSYHLLNVFLHLFNVWLAWRLAWRLSRGDSLVSFVTALFFGVHPMHVESVAWVSERKDVLYTAFFLAGLELWTRYVDDGRRWAYAGAFCLMILSAASKPAAIVFPLVLFVIEFFRGRRLTLVTVIEKIPFFAVGGVLALLTRSAQSAVGAMARPEVFSIQRRIIHAAFGLMMYIVRALFPDPLVAFWPFPAIKDPLPAPYLIAPFLCAAVAIFGWTVRKKIPAATFGLLFYLVNLVLVIQLIPVGSAVIADRYTYVPYWGLFFGGAIFALTCFSRATVWKVALVGGAVCVALSFRQAGFWKSGETLWDHDIRERPNFRAYANRGQLYRDASKKGGPDARFLGDQAVDLYTKALRTNPQDDMSLSNRGNVYFDRGQYELAIPDYDKALALKPDNVSALDNRGAAHAARGELSLAYADFARALRLDPAYRSAYKNQATALFNEKRYAEAMAGYQKYLTFDPSDADVVNSVGVCQQGLGRYEDSIATIDAAIRLVPKGAFFLNRAISNFNLHRIDAARIDAGRAAEKGAAVPPALMEAIQKSGSRTGSS